jgi:hypothetical protein
MTRYILLAALAVLLAPLAPHAQTTFDVDRLDAMFDSPPMVEVNLRGSLLKLAAAAAGDDEPEARLMLENLRAVTVRVYAAGSERPRFLSSMNAIGDDFERDGWMTMVRVRSIPGSDNEDGDVWVYVLDDGDSFGGMAVMAIANDEDDEDGDGETAVFVHIDGTISPDDVALLSKRFGDVDISTSWNDDEDDDE